MQSEELKKRDVLKGILIALVPLVCLAFDPSGMDSFSLPKLTVLRFCVIAALAYYALCSLEEGKLFWKWGKGAAAMFSFVGIMIVATSISKAPAVSLVGVYGFRMDGLLSWIAYATLFWMGLVFVDRLEMMKVGWAAAITGFILGIYAVLQYRGIDVTRWTSDPTRNRIWATFGNPNFLAASITMIVPLTAMVIAQEKRTSIKILLVFPLLLDLWVLSQTLSRAAWLGCAVGTFVYLILCGISFPNLIRKKILVLFVLAAIGLGFLVPWVSVSKRVQAGLNLDSPEWIFRRAGWKAAGRMIKERPFIGYGADGYHLNFRKYMDTSFFRMTHQTLMSPVYPHNETLQIAVDTGLIGLAVYAFLLFSLLRAAIRRRGDLIWAGCAASLAAVWINNQFSFHNIATASIFYFLGGALIGSELPARERPLWPSVSKGFNYSVLTILIGLFGFIGFIICVRIELADRIVKEASQYDEKGKIELALRRYKKALELNPHEPAYLHRFAQLGLRLSQMSKSSSAKKMWLEGTGNVYSNIIALNPLDALGYNGLGTVHARLFQSFGAPLADRAEQEFRQAAALDPQLAEAWTNLGALYFAREKKSEALEAYLTAKDINPYAPQIYHDIGVFYALQGDYDRAKQYWNEALELDPNYKDAQIKLNMLDSGKLKEIVGGKTK